AEKSCPRFSPPPDHWAAEAEEASWRFLHFHTQGSREPREFQSQQGVYSCWWRLSSCVPEKASHLTRWRKSLAALLRRGRDVRFPQPRPDGLLDPSEVTLLVAVVACDDFFDLSRQI